MGIHIHKILDRDNKQSSKGADPFTHITLGDKTLSSVVKLYDPPQSDSGKVYSYIQDNLADWVEEAIKIRSKY